MIKYNDKTIVDGKYNSEFINKMMYNGREVHRRFIADGEPTPPVPPTPPTPIGKYFTIVFLENGDFRYLKDVNSGDLYYSLDEGATWSLIENNITYSFNEGDRVAMKGNVVSTIAHSCGMLYSTVSAKVNLEGNYMSLKYMDDFEDKTEFPSAEYIVTERSTPLCWVMLHSLKIVDASKMIIPLQRIPEYGNVFRSLLGEQKEMIASPILATETLTTYVLGGCYRELFKGDSKLNKVICLAKNNLNNSTMAMWLQNAAATGVIYKDPQADWSNAPIPSGWTLEDYQG